MPRIFFKGQCCSEVYLFYICKPEKAQVAKLVNVAVSEAVAVTGLRVRVSLWAHWFFKLGYCPGGEIGRRTILRGWRS